MESGRRKSSGNTGWLMLRTRLPILYSAFLQDAASSVERVVASFEKQCLQSIVTIAHLLQLTSNTSRKGVRPPWLSTRTNR